MKNWIKSTITILSLLGVIAGGIYTVEDRYITNAQAASSLENFNSKVQQDILKVKIDILEGRKEALNAEYYQHKRLIRAYPDDTDLVQELDEIKLRRNRVESEIQELMR